MKCFNFSERKHFKNICSSLSLDISPFSLFLITATLQILPPTSFPSFINQSAVTNSHHFNPGQTLCFKTPIYHLSQGSEFTQALPQVRWARGSVLPLPTALFPCAQMQKSGDHKKENLVLNVFSVPLSGCFISSSEMHGEWKHEMFHRLFNLGSSSPHIFHITHIPLLELNSNRPGTTSLT